jgi:hypothetical protein
MNLHDAYLRPCFICRISGPCPHREPQVELAYFYARSLPERRPPQIEHDIQAAERKASHA